MSDERGKKVILTNNEKLVWAAVFAADYLHELDRAANSSGRIEHSVPSAIETAWAAVIDLRELLQRG